MSAPTDYFPVIRGITIGILGELRGFVLLGWGYPNAPPDADVMLEDAFNPVMHHSPA